MERLLVIALGGALGAVARYGVSGLVARASHEGTFPWGTLVVNVVGAFLLGALMGAAATGPLLISPRLRATLAIGFLGAFTTFSTFTFETLEALRAGDVRVAILNVVVSVTIGLAACWAGLTVGEALA